MGRLVIIGGVAAGLSAASRARRVAAGEEIVVLERGPAAGYGACGLPYFLSGQVPALERLLAHPPEFFRERRRLDLRLGHEVVEIAPGRRGVRVRVPDGEEQWIGYDRLVIATGASSRWRLERNLRNVFSANTWAQAARLREALELERFQHVVVVGAGYIGLEVAEALRLRGLAVTLVDAHGSPLHGFDEELAAALETRLRTAGIAWHPGCRVLGLEGADGGRVGGVSTAAGVLAADLVVNCGGLRPETRLAQAAGLQLGASGAIAVDERQQTSVAGIWAAGDCSETRHLVTGAPVWIPLGAAANKQGRVAGQNAAGGVATRFPGVLGTLAVPLFGMEFGRTGLTLAQARAAGFDAAAEKVETGSQAGYLNPQPVTLKIVYQPSTGRLLGCHVSGAPGTVTGRLDAAAVCLSAGMRLDQIQTLDLAYSPALAPLYEALLIASHNALEHGDRQAAAR